MGTMPLSISLSTEIIEQGGGSLKPHMVKDSFSSYCGPDHRRSGNLQRALQLVTVFPGCIESRMLKWVMDHGMYVPGAPVQHLISLDWDYFIYQSLDHLFDVPVSPESLLAVPGGNPATFLNGGFLVLSPGYGDDYISFWQALLRDYNGWHYFCEGATVLRSSEQETFAYFYIKHGPYYILPQRYNVLMRAMAFINDQNAASSMFNSLAGIHGGGYQPGSCNKPQHHCSTAFGRFSNDYNYLFKVLNSV
ncbi:hypothetical protein P9112_001620 [Eukaryota sp. TZLM1-RC]